MSAMAIQVLRNWRIADHDQLSQAENHRRESVAALQKAGNVRSRLAAFEANLKLGADSRPPTSSYLKAPSCLRLICMSKKAAGLSAQPAGDFKSATGALCIADTAAMLMSWNHRA